MNKQYLIALPGAGLVESSSHPICFFPAITSHPTLPKGNPSKSGGEAISAQAASEGSHHGKASQSASDWLFLFNNEEWRQKKNWSSFDGIHNFTCSSPRCGIVRMQGLSHRLIIPCPPMKSIIRVLTFIYVDKKHFEMRERGYSRFSPEHFRLGIAPLSCCMWARELELRFYVNCSRRTYAVIPLNILCFNHVNLLLNIVHLGSFLLRKLSILHTVFHRTASLDSFNPATTLPFLQIDTLPSD